MDQPTRSGCRCGEAVYHKAQQLVIDLVPIDIGHSSRFSKAALTALSEWLAQYLKIAKVALRDKPQLFEKLGGIARSSRTVAQRQAPKKAAATRAARKAA